MYKHDFIVFFMEVLGIPWTHKWITQCSAEVGQATRGRKWATIQEENAKSGKNRKNNWKELYLWLVEENKTIQWQWHEKGQLKRIDSGTSIAQDERIWDSMDEKFQNSSLMNVTLVGCCSDSPKFCVIKTMMGVITECDSVQCIIIYIEGYQKLLQALWIVSCASNFG